MAEKLSTERLTHWLEQTCHIPMEVADALVRHHGVDIWRVDNSVNAGDCMPRRVSIYDLRHADGLYVSRPAALKHARKNIASRIDTAEKLIRSIDEELKDV